MPDLPSVSILMLAHNQRHCTERALDALLLSEGARFQAVLVDNGSTDGTEEVFDRFQARAEAKGWSVLRLAFSDNIGAVAGRNAALEIATGEYLALCDNDVVIGRRSWAPRLIARFAAEPKLGVVAPLILFAAAPHEIQCAGCIVGRGGRVAFRGRGEPADSPAYAAWAEVQALISAFWLMPRAVAERTGRFDMEFHPVQFEDIDYCYRIRQAGWTAAVDPSVRVYHFENSTTARTPEIRYRGLTLRNGLRFKRRWAATAAKEGGPEDADLLWKNIPSVAFNAVGDLPVEP